MAWAFRCAGEVALRDITDLKQGQPINPIRALAKVWRAKLAMHMAEAWLNFSKARSQAMLSLIGVVIGCAAIVAAVTIGVSSAAQSRLQFLAMQPDVWVMRVPSPVNGKTTPFKRADVEAMPSNIPSVRSVAAIGMVFRTFKATRAAPLPADAANMAIAESGAGAANVDVGAAESVSFIALDEPLAELLGLRVAQGRSLTAHDGMVRHVLLGAELAQRLAGPGGYPVLPGDAVRFDDAIYRVVGILKAGDFPAGLPLNINGSAFYREGKTGAFSRGVDSALIRVDLNVPAQQVQKEVSAYWKALLGGRRPALDPPSQLLTAMDGQTHLLAILLGSMAAMAILLGGLGILNTQLIAVRQRRQEIGIRLAIGARPADICALFLAEAALLSTVGGVLGALLGALASAAFALATGMPVVLAPLALLLGTGVCTSTGLLAGIYPAWRASRLHPVQAMQHA